MRKLEEEKIIYLEYIDGKSKKSCLTEKGKNFTSKTVNKIIQIENEICESWSYEEMTKYIELSERFVKELDKKVEKL